MLNCASYRDSANTGIIVNEDAYHRTLSSETTLETATVSVSMPFDKRHTLIYPRFNFPGHSTQWHWAYSSGMYAFFLKAPITYFKQSPTFRSCRSQVANLDLEFPLTKALKPSKEPRSQVSPGSYRPLGLLQ